MIFFSIDSTLGSNTPAVFKDTSVALKVLLADDSMTAQNMGKKILADAGYQVIAVSNGAQAMKKLASEKPDMVVLDVYMPGYTGLEICERIKNAPDTASTPVILCVAKMEPFRQEDGRRVKADAVIIKPFEATDLVGRMQELEGQLKRHREAHPQPPPEPVASTIESVEPAEAAEDESSAFHRIEVPEEMAAAPAFGTEFVTEASAESAVEAPAPEPVIAVEFEVEHEREPVEVARDFRMAAAEGLSGVFEMQPAPAAPAEMKEFEVAAPPVPSKPDALISEPQESQPHETQVPLEEQPAAVGDTEVRVAAEAAAAAEVEPSPEFVVERVSIPVSGDDQVQPEPRCSEPADSVVGAPDIVAYSSVEEAAPFSSESMTPEPQQFLPSERAEIASDASRPSKPAVSAASEFAPTAPVWIAEEIPLGDDSNVSLEEEMRASVSSEVVVQLEPAEPAVMTEVLPPETSEPALIESAEASTPADWRPADNWVGVPQGPSGEGPTESGLEAAEIPAELPTSAFQAPGPEFPPPIIEAVVEAASEPAAASPAESSGAAEAAGGEARQPELIPPAASNQGLAMVMAAAVAESLPTAETPAAVDAAVVEQAVDRLLGRLKPELVAEILRELGKK